MKTILVLLDGLGDRSYPCLKYRTPLEAARKPNLNRLAALGSTGLLHASMVGECLPSEMAHYLLFGYDRNCFPGRGLLEAVGEDIPFDDQDILVLAHMAGISWKSGLPILTRGRDDIAGTYEDLGRLFAALSPYEADDVRFELYQTRRNDAILVLKGAVSPFISDSDPILKGQPMGRVVPLSDNPEPEQAAHTAAALNLYLSHCHAILSDAMLKADRGGGVACGANFLATQRSGRRVSQIPFGELWGFKGQMIASGGVYAGLAHELGFDFIKAVDSQQPDRDLRERIRMALDDGVHDFVHVHTKVPDEAGHHGNPTQKQKQIAALDRGLDELVRSLAKRDDLLVVVTADHSTPCESRLVHSGESVPLLMAGPTVRRDKVTRFDEISAAAGGLGTLRGRELMLMILNCTERSALVGHQLGPEIRSYVSRHHPVFKPT